MRLNETKPSNSSDFSLKRPGLLRLIRWWMTPKLPEVHIFIKPQLRPKGFLNTFKVYFRKWLVHPVKRRIAKYYLAYLRRFFNITVIGITGSAGKTTTKEMLASILKTYTPRESDVPLRSTLPPAGCSFSPHGSHGLADSACHPRGDNTAVVYSFANIDPVYNIPTTILKCWPSTKYLILEMGVEYPGEMDYYLWLAKPDIGIITNIYPTHTEYFGDEKGVFEEKSKLIRKLIATDFAVLNSSNQPLMTLKGKIRAKIVWFGGISEIISFQEKIEEDATTSFHLMLDPSVAGQTLVHLPVIGKQFVENALAAAAVAKILGFGILEIKNGLEKFKVQDHRMSVIKHKSGATIIDDSYNNNPVAAKEALETFLIIAKSKRRVVVFGDMLELGNWEKKYHIELGEYLAKSGISYLICVGYASRITARKAAIGIGKNRVWAVEKAEDVLPLLLPHLAENTVVLIKGSRSIGLDKLVDQLN